MHNTSSAVGTTVGVVVGVVVYVLYVVALWRIFSKANYAGWLALIPIVNMIVFIKVGGRSGWYVLLYLIPLVNLVVHYLVGLWVSRSFGHGHGYAIGLFLLPWVFSLVLGFDGSEHRAGRRRSTPTGGTRLATA